MRVSNRFYTIEWDEANGSLLSLGNGRKSFLWQGEAPRPLFAIRFRDAEGRAIDVNALQAATVTSRREGAVASQRQGADTAAASQREDADTAVAVQREDADTVAAGQREGAAPAVRVVFEFTGLAGLPVNATATALCRSDRPRIEWGLEIDNGTDHVIEWIDYPDVTVPNDLIAKGGEARILWSAMEGVLVEDVDKRENTWLRYKEPGYPSKGWEGLFPGPSPTQFISYLGGKGGNLYLGAHDARAEVKSIEYVKLNEDAIRLQFRLFPGAPGRGLYRLGYPMVLELFDGDWQGAGDLYREWHEASDARKAKPFKDNERLPRWMHESPVVVTYPVRGKKDTGDMTPNEYFPYAAAMPHIRDLAAAFDSKVLALLMHWEGTAPWAPPYVWPPFGGEDIFRQFADELHAEGHLLGVYGSGTGWTNESLLVPEYRPEGRYVADNLERFMCASPEGEVPNSYICNGHQRWGKDLCPTTDFAANALTGEVEAIIGADVDYIQYFDQNLGGLSYFCYNADHGHPPAPGVWQKEAMMRIYAELNERIRASGKEIAIGCEAAAAEPFIPDLPFNDMRFNIAFMFGRPVPLYQYVYHKYINNFMGNQNLTVGVIDVPRTPLNLYYRIAYSFVAGDMLTAVLAGGGRIHWDWGCEWDVPLPDHDRTAAFIKELNGWRRGVGKPYLQYGEMQAPCGVEVGGQMTLHHRDGRSYAYPGVLDSLWKSDAGYAQVLVNYTDAEQMVDWTPDVRLGRAVAIYDRADASAEAAETRGISAGTPMRLVIPAGEVRLLECLSSC